MLPLIHRSFSHTTRSGSSRKKEKISRAGTSRDTCRAPLVLLRRSIAAPLRSDTSMIPLRDNAAPRRLTPVNTALIAANIAVFVYELSLGPRVTELRRQIRDGAGAVAQP